MPLVLTTHEEKVNFLTKFLRDENPHYARDRLLVLVGSGGNGKSIVLSEVLETTPVNVVVICENRFSFRPATTGPSDECSYIMVCNGDSSDFAFAAYLNANVVQFLVDPKFQRT